MKTEKIIKVVDFEGFNREFSGTRKQFLEEQQELFPSVEMKTMVDPDTKEIVSYDAEEMRIMKQEFLAWG